MLHLNASFRVNSPKQNEISIVKSGGSDLFMYQHNSACELFETRGVFCTATKFVPNNYEVHNTANGRSDCDFIWRQKKPSVSSYSDVKIAVSISTKDSILGWKFQEAPASATSLCSQSSIVPKNVHHTQFNTHLQIAAFLASKLNFRHAVSLHCL